MAYRGKRNAQDDYEQTIKWHQGLSGNVLLQESAFAMLSDAIMIEELICDYSPGRIPPKVHKVLNGLWKQFRYNFRKTLSISEEDIPELDREFLQDIKKLMDKPYGSYDFRKLTQAAHDYFGILRRMRLILISFEHEEMSSEAKFNKP